MNDEPVTIRRADLSDAARISYVLAAALHHDPLARWLFPDDADRLRRQPAFYQVLTEHALTWGLVHTTPDYDGAALWLHHNGTSAPDIEHADRLRTALGPNTDRYAALARLLAQHHPHGLPHAHLPLIAVVPECQGHGIGTTLLHKQLSQLDTDQVPAYLAASTKRSQRLYERLGFRPVGNLIDIPRGPQLRPMWRQQPHWSAAVARKPPP